MTFAQCTAFVANLRSWMWVLQGFQQLSKELADTGLTAKGILKTNELRKSLDGKGLKIEVEEEIYGPRIGMATVKAC